MHKALEFKGIFGRRKDDDFKFSTIKLSSKSNKQSRKKGKHGPANISHQQGDGNSHRKETVHLSSQRDKQDLCSDNDLEDPLGLVVKATDARLDVTCMKGDVTYPATDVAFLLKQTTSTQSCPSSPDGSTSADSSFMSSCCNSSAASSPVLATDSCRDSPMSSPDASPYKQIFQEDDSGEVHRVYRKVHPLPKSRMRRFLPSSPSRLTIADVGCQVNTVPDVGQVITEMKSEVVQVTELAKSYRDMVDETKDRLNSLERKTTYLSEKNMSLERILEEKNSQLDGLKEKLVAQQKDLQHLQAEVLQERMRTEESLIKVRQQESQIFSLEKQMEESDEQCRDLRNQADKAQLTMAFIHEDKLDLQKELNERRELVASLRMENERVHKESQDFKYLYLETKVKSSEVLGKYLDELNLVMEEKRQLLERHKVSSKTLAKMIERLEDHSILKEENHRLVDQIEYLTTRTVAQELHVEELQEQLCDLSRLLAAYERDAAYNGYDVIDAQNSLIMKSDRAALKRNGHISDIIGGAANSLDDSREIRTPNGSPKRQSKSPDGRCDRQMTHPDQKLPILPYDYSEKYDDYVEFKSPREAGDSF